MDRDGNDSGALRLPPLDDKDSDNSRPIPTSWTQSAHTAPVVSPASSSHIPTSQLPPSNGNESPQPPTTPSEPGAPAAPREARASSRFPLFEDIQAPTPLAQTAPTAIVPDQATAAFHASASIQTPSGLTVPQIPPPSMNIAESPKIIPEKRKASESYDNHI